MSRMLKLHRAPWGWYYGSFDFGHQQAVCFNRFSVSHGCRYIGKKRTLKNDIRARRKLNFWFHNMLPCRRFRLWQNQRRSGTKRNLRFVLLKRRHHPVRRLGSSSSASRWSENTRSRLRRK